jgi:hypothetical protein
MSDSFLNDVFKLLVGLERAEEPEASTDVFFGAFSVSETSELDEEADELDVDEERERGDFLIGLVDEILDPTCLVGDLDLFLFSFLAVLASIDFFLPSLWPLTCPSAFFLGIFFVDRIFRLSCH